MATSRNKKLCKLPPPPSTTIKQSKERKEVDKILQWDSNGIGLLPASDLKFKVVGPDKLLYLCEPETPERAESPPPSPSAIQQLICNCRTCGCFGLRNEFYKPNYCVYACYMSSNENDKFLRNAPIKLFKRPALPINNPFIKGQMLEAIDPENQSLFCVVSVAEVVGYRIKLHFEGYSKQFDFYTNADSLDIFPAGWCEENNLELQPPPNFTSDLSSSTASFNWSPYLMLRKSNPCPRSSFQVTKETSSLKTGVEVGMKLEAVDIRNPNNMIICVATVTQVLGERFLIHFDSWDHIYDYWADLTCPFIFPVGHCVKINKKITPPNNYKQPFRWDEYLKKSNTVAMPARLFQPLPPVGFKKGMRIEAVDLKNPSLIRPGVIASTEGHMLTVHYEGWAESYDVKFTELSPDIHPVGYCEHTGHPIEDVPVIVKKKNSKDDHCQVYGCQGKGHALKIEETHQSEKDCPYNLNNANLINNERVIIVTTEEGARSVIAPGSTKSVTGTTTTTTAKKLIKKVLSMKHRPKSSTTFTTKTTPPKLLLKKRTLQLQQKQITEKKMKDLATMILLQRKTVRKESYLFERVVSKVTMATAKNWDCNDVSAFIKTIPNCSGSSEMFKEQMIDGDALLLLTKNDLQEVKFGQAVKIHYAIQLIKNK